MRELFSLGEWEWKLSLRRWHSINLVPTLSLSSVCTDLPPFKIVARYLELTIFGLIICVAYPSNKTKRGFITEARGPLYSRRRKCWYRASKIVEDEL